MKNIQGEIVKDINGVLVNPGDIMIGQVGYDSASKYKYKYNIWEMPEIADGTGTRYGLEGIGYYYNWARAHESIKLNPLELPDGFLFSFRHGMGSIYCKLETPDTVKDLIKNSDWINSQITEKDLEQFKFKKTLKINTIEDIKKNIKYLSYGFVPSKIISKVFEIYGVQKTIAHNGEIGIASMFDKFHYLEIIEHVRNELRNDKKEKKNEM